MSRKVESAGDPSQDERVLAAVAHGGVIWPMWGLVAPLVVWATQREKSDFVRFQALQAAAYQLILIVVGLLGAVLYGCAILSMPFGLVLAGLLAEVWYPGVFCVPFAGLFCAFGIGGLLGLVWLAYLGYGLYGVVCALQGRDFRYVFIGPWMERYLKQG